MITMRQALQNTAQGKLITNGADNGFRKFCPAADFVGFDGHFPEYPILPAMLQILLGIIVSEELYGKKLALQKLDKAKFMAQIQPEQSLTVSCKITRPAAENLEQTIKARIIITSKEQKAASMTLFLNQT
ncbi:MAG: hypothetical protein U9Q39_01080 [Pseudomonadota bacterium]|nr:hypothetical protein [Pseudomonadota bacterium]